MFVLPTVGLPLEAVLLVGKRPLSKYQSNVIRNWQITNDEFLA